MVFMLVCFPQSHWCTATKNQANKIPLLGLCRCPLDTRQLLLAIGSPWLTWHQYLLSLSIHLHTEGWNLETRRPFVKRNCTRILIPRSFRVACKTIWNPRSTGVEYGHVSRSSRYDLARKTQLARFSVWYYVRCIYSSHFIFSSSKLYISFYLALEDFQKLLVPGTVLIFGEKCPYI